MWHFLSKYNREGNATFSERPTTIKPAGRIEPGSLEALIRTGSPKLCYLYHTVSKGGLRRRRGDKHLPKSLLKYECLPRLIDSLMAEDPPFAFQASSAAFVSPERHAAEVALGFEPRSLRRFWTSTGGGADQRFAVPEDSEEFADVKTIFEAEPAVKSFYNRGGVTMADKDVVRIERIENDGQQEGLDAGYGTLKKSFEKAGIPFVGGVHTRWLFHGTKDPDVVIANNCRGSLIQAGASTGT